MHYIKSTKKVSSYKAFLFVAEEGGAGKKVALHIHHLERDEKKIMQTFDGNHDLPVINNAQGTL